MRRTDYASFSEFLTRIGVALGDVLMVHSFLPSLGVMADGLEGLYRALRDRLGAAGTLIVPAFTYSFCRGEDFDVRRSPSVVGSFSEFVRGREEIARSADPIFSIAAAGSAARDLTRVDHEVCFGPGSTFERLESAGVRFLLLGIDYRKSLTYFLHLEKLAGVPYREDKVFSGTIVDEDGRSRPASFVYNVRRDPNGIRMDYNRVGFEFDATPWCRREELGYARHRLFGASELKAFTMPRLAADPYCLTQVEASSMARG